MKKTIHLLLVLTLALAGCTAEYSSEKTAAADKHASQPRPETGFKKIRAGKSVNLLVTVGPEFSVAVEGEPAAFDSVKTGVEGETLVVLTGTERAPAGGRPRLRITLPALERLELWGSSEATVANAQAETLELQVSGNSSLKIDGAAGALAVGAVGTTRIDAENLKTRRAEATATGASQITVSVAEELTAQALGASTIYYVGDPPTVRPAITGTGEIRKK